MYTLQSRFVNETLTLGRPNIVLELAISHGQRFKKRRYAYSSCITTDIRPRTVIHVYIIYNLYCTHKSTETRTEKIPRGQYSVWLIFYFVNLLYYYITFV